MAVVLITGAGSGFGQVTALAFARRGDTVYAAVRSPEGGGDSPGRTAGQGELKVVPLDVRNSESIRSAVDLIAKNEGRIDVLVNNAGIHLPGAVEDMPEEDLRAVMETNFFGALEVTRTVVPLMRRQREGRIIMISSVGAMIGRVADAIYCASKSALEAASEALRYEVARFGISVSVLEPGVFRTAIGGKYRLSQGYPRNSPYRALLEFRIRKVKEACSQGDDPEQLAELILKVAGEKNPRFRYAAGKQAEEILPRLQAMNDLEREAFIRGAAQIDWWLEGVDAPD